jgi:hypothetical protein
MSAPMMITLTQHDIESLNAMAKGNLSHVIRDLVSEYDLSQVSEFVKTDRKTCRFDASTEAKLKRDAEMLGTSTSGLVRAILESKLNAAHH